MDHRNSTDDTVPRFDQSAYNFTPSQAATTYAGSMAGATSYHDLPADADETGTRISTYSYRSDRDGSKYLREAHGRAINTLSDQYFLPADTDEWTRLDKQHTAIILGMGGLYPAADQVRAILKAEPGNTKRVLDLGCGTGVWAVEMAKEFPEAEVVGVDLTPCPISAGELPPNCRFEVDDINLGLSHFENQFDLIHLRLVHSGLKNFRKSMADIENCLKPGGIVIWIDMDYDLYSQDTFVHMPTASELHPNGAWLSRPAYEMRRSAVLGGSDVHTMEKVLDEEGLWTSPRIDPDTCKTASMFLPIGPWATSSNATEDQYLKYVGALMRQDILSGHRAVHPLLIRSGWTKEVVNDWSDKADLELASLENKMSLRIRLAWGRRRAGPGLPAPPLPELSTTTSSSDDAEETSGRRYFPYFFVYDTQEESQEQAAKRNRDKPEEVPFHPANRRVEEKK